MPPIFLLLALLLLTGIAWLADRRLRGRGQAVYRELAIAGGMHYSPSDPLRLTPRVAAAFPVPGAAAVRVLDLLYRTDEHNHYYVFTAEYTVGVVGPKHRVRRAASLIESKLAGSAPQPIRLGRGDVPLLEQYRLLIAAEGSDGLSAG